MVETSLLQSLQLQNKDDFNASISSVEDCLRCGVVMGSPLMSKILMQSTATTIEKAEIKASTDSILISLSHWKQQEHATSMLLIRKFATLFLFCEFLLRFDASDDELATTSSSYATKDSEIREMVVIVLQNITNVICFKLELQRLQKPSSSKSSATKNQLNNGATIGMDLDAHQTHQLFSRDATLAFDARQLAFYAVARLLRLHNYVHKDDKLVRTLWTAIYDITCSCQTPIPTAIASDATTLLTARLQVELTALEASDETNGAFLQFVNQLALFLPMCTAAAASNNFMGACCCAMAVTTSETFDRVQKAVVASIVDVNSNLVRVPQLESLLNCTQAALINKDDDRHHFMGKALLLRQVLVAIKGVDANSALRIVQELVFRTLPRLMEPLMQNDDKAINAVSTSVACMVEAMAVCSANARVPSDRFARLLVSWLAPPPSRKGGADLHPLARELAVSIMAAQVQKSADLLLAQYLIKLLFDARSHSVFRENVASVLIRAVTGSRQEAVEHILASEAARFEANMRPERRKKRKQTNSKAISVLPLEDLEQVCNVISCLSCKTTLSGNPANISETSISLTWLEYYAIRTAIAVADSEKIGDAPYAILRKLWTSPDRHKPPFIARLALWSSQVLRLAHRLMDKDKLSAADCIAYTCPLVFQICSNKQTLQSPELLPAVFEATVFLGKMGKLLTENTSQTIFNDIAGTFHSLFSCNAWPIHSKAITAFLALVSMTPACHRTQLIKSVPKNVRKLMQFRIKGTAYIEVGQELTTLNATCAKLVADVSTERTFGDTVFPVTNSVYLPVGSTVVAVPMPNGQMAQVVFPLGDKSVENIRFMQGLLSNDSDKVPPAQTLQRLSILDDGTGKMWLSE
jgi:hypothetical protein